ncbi:MAG TPA: site-specific DNA-methyltransferase [Candidatus Atribacteria bacterium]|nr:site-specific DNA-methyltransferase [Candidatus Atribacteria bacterium]
MINKVNRSVKIDIKEGLKALYPEVFEDNKVNFEKLKALLSGEIIEKEDDRFYFNWAGKRNLYKIIQAPAYGTLKPDKEKSVDFDNTENIVIVGENLETLKLLLKPYFGNIKMIYIDPPYNTGKDFIYRDNFKQPLKDYLEKTGQIDSGGKKLTTNTEASGRYHSDWLNFIYPRLFLARSLLRDDGVIFISIDDNEVHHLRMIMDEIFGEENFICCFVRKSGIAPRQDAKYVATQHDYVVCYSKNISQVSVNRKISEAKGFDFEDEYVSERGKFRLNKLDRGSIHYSEGLDYPITAPDGSEVWPGGDHADKRWTWRWSRNKVKWGIENGFIVFKKVRNGQWSVYYKEYELVDNEGNPRERTNPFDTFIFEAYNEKGNTDVSNLFENRVFEYPKPVDLIKNLLKIASKESSFILDFFAGSGTTGQAVWDLNKEDGGNRKFIIVQLDEEVKDEEIKKEFPTVADICIERLRRVSEKYKKEEDGQIINNNQDFGFKVFRLDKSNFNLKDEFKFNQSEDKEELKKKYLEWLGMWVDKPLVSDAKEIDVIYEVMLKEGLNLNSKIEKIKIKDDEFYYIKDEVQNLDFYISLKDKFTPDTIEEIRTSKYKGKMFVFLDSALTDSDKINLSAFVRLKVI